jgi:succinate dehydrogenase / fumarate reductase, cytochrome b subunit
MRLRTIAGTAAVRYGTVQGFHREMRGMADATVKQERPLSPHLGIYKMKMSMAMSIIHRITGAALYFGTILLAAWLIGLAQGPKAFDTVNTFFGHPIGLFVMFGYTWALIHHMLGGVRHFIWDTGRGFNLSTVNLLSWLAPILSVILTVAIWAYAFRMRGMI